MKELAILKGLELRTLDDTALARIDAGMLEQNRISAIFGRRNTQTTVKLMSLQMMTAGPYRRLRQCAAEIEQRKNALRDNAFRMRRAMMEAKHFRVQAGKIARELASPAFGEALVRLGPHGAPERVDRDALAFERDRLLLDAEEREEGIRTGRTYVEGALKELAALLDAYDQIRASAGIRDTWDEADFEAGELEHHFRAVFQLAFFETKHYGNMTQAGCEYSLQFGLHPLTVQHEVDAYTNANLARLEAGELPHGGDLNAWLDAMYAKYRNCLQHALDALGLTELITRYSLFTERQQAAEVA